METCFKILQLKFDKKLTNRCIGLTLHISASTVFEVLARFKASSLSWPLCQRRMKSGSSATWVEENG
ncbi:hypothetical protein KUR66_005019 [Escherichia coli]|nr:hypothetical protein [Escherichia coli]